MRAANLEALHGKHMAAFYCVLLFRLFVFRLMAVFIKQTKNTECIEIYKTALYKSTTRLWWYITGCCCWMLPTWHFVLLLINIFATIKAANPYCQLPLIAEMRKILLIKCIVSIHFTLYKCQHNHINSRVKIIFNYQLTVSVPERLLYIRAGRTIF